MGVFFVLQNPQDTAGSPYRNSKGSAECVEYVRKVTCAPPAEFWREGMRVQGNEAEILPGTAIATFVDGRYPNQATGNHAAIFLRKTHNGIVVMDQFRKKDKVSERTIRYKSPEEISAEKKSGKYKMSNDAGAYSVISVVNTQHIRCD